MSDGRAFGLAWRSGNVNSDRAPYYVTDLADLAPLFALAAAQRIVLVRLQYDDCEAEL